MCEESSDTGIDVVVVDDREIAALRWDLGPDVSAHTVVILTVIAKDGALGARRRLRSTTKEH